MSNGYYQGYKLGAGTLCMMCVGELCWQRAKDENGNEQFVINPDKQMYTLIEAGGGVLK